MMKDFHFSHDAAWNDLPIIQAIAYRNTLLEANPYLDRISDGYIAQEARK
jgi:hypothetical protein